LLLNPVSLLTSIPGVIDDLWISKIKYSTNNSRTKVSSILDLMTSIKENGLLQPIVVRPKGDHYEIVAGNRRCKACAVLKWRKITCHIVELDDRAAFECSLVENIQRETLSVVEEAEAFRNYVVDFGWGGISQLARRIGKSPSYITKRIKLLDMPSDVLKCVEGMTLNSSLAEELLPVKDSAKQSQLAVLIRKRHLSLRKTRELVSQYREEEKNHPSCSCNDTRLHASSLQVRQKAFDKMILTMRITLNNIGQLIDDLEEDDDWMLREMFMQHRSMIHGQIDLLIKEKQKLRYI